MINTISQVILAYSLVASGTYKLMIPCGPLIISFSIIIMSDQNTNSCEIFGIAGIIVQLFLGALSFSVLIIKRYYEYPKRSWKIWAMDTSKQGVSQLIAHFINVGISLLLSNHLDNDACIWYLVTNVLDNTVGVFFCCGVLRLIENYILAGKWDQFRSGNYYDIIEFREDNYKVYESYAKDDQSEKQRQSVITTSSNNDNIQETTATNSNNVKPLQIQSTKRIILISYFAWIIQFLIWNLIVAVCKSILFIFQLLLNVPLNAIGMFLLGWVQPYQTAELIIVIIIIPVIMNGLAFWIQDNFLKKPQQNTSPPIRQPLL